jgi:hypothetical protein
VSPSFFPGFHHLRHSQIDFERWDESLQRAHSPLPYAESYYLHALAPGWNALISEDYTWLMPLPCNRNLLGFQQVYQPYFVQQLGLFGPESASASLVKQALLAIPRSYLRVRQCLNAENTVPKVPGIRTSLRPNYLLALELDYSTLSSAYSKSLRKRVRRASELHTLDKAPCSPSELIHWYRQHQGGKANLPVKAYLRLQAGMEKALANNKGFIWGARDHAGALRVAGFFLCNDQRIINLFGSSDEEGRELFSMHYLLDQVIQQHAGQPRLLDFEGSSIPGVAAFFESFGSYNHSYTFIERTFPTSMRRL